VTAALFYTDTGASGTVRITAPLPALETMEVPYALIALTLA
jgi:hypothetical protein